MTQQVVQGDPINLTANFYDGPGGILSDPSSVSLSIYHDGSLVDGPYTYAAAAITKVTTGVYRYAYTVAADAEVGSWEARWTVVIDAVTTVGTELFEVIAGGYATLTEIRQLDMLAGNVDAYTDEMLQEGLDWATQRIEDETGTSWVYRTHTATVSGNGTNEVFVRRPFVRTITSCTIGGIAQAVTGWFGTDDGMVVRPDGVFPISATGSNVEFVFAAGATATPPADIRWAVRTLARWYVLNLLSKAPDNALSVAGEYGTVQLAQPGKYGPTSLPEVNAVIARRSHRIPGVG